MINRIKVQIAKERNTDNRDKMIFAIKIIKFNYLIKGYRHGRNIAREVQKFYRLTGINNNFDCASTLWIDTNELKECFIFVI